MGMIDTIGNLDRLITISKPILEVFDSKVLPEVKMTSDKLYILAEKYPSIEPFAAAIDKVADIAASILFALGVETDGSELLGMKIMQAERSMSDFDSIEAYVDYLSREVSVDQDEIDQLNDAERLVYTIAGVSLDIVYTSEKLGIDIGIDFYIDLSKVISKSEEVIDAVNIVEFISLCVEKGISTMDTISDYFRGIGSEDRLAIGEMLNDIFEPLVNDRAEDMIMNIKRMVRE